MSFDVALVVLGAAALGRDLPTDPVVASTLRRRARRGRAGAARAFRGRTEAAGRPPGELTLVLEPG